MEQQNFSQQKEIEIVGAGISGLTAGINLAKAGYKVKIFEKNNVIGKRFHGDFQGIENWAFDQDALEHIRSLSIDLTFPYYPVNNLKIIGPKEKIYNLKLRRNAFYLVRRGIEQDTLDQNLYQQAKKAGVDIVFNSPKDHREFGDIVAQGYFPDKVTDAIATGYNFLTDIPDQCWAIVDDNIAPDGYGYFLVAGGKATLAVCIFRGFDKANNYLDRAYQVFQKHAGFQAKDQKLFGGTSNGFLMKGAIFDKRLYVGEAAGFIDGMWGFGMKYALISGYCAALSIIKNENYDKLWKQHILSQLKASLVNSWYYKILGNRSYEFILKKMQKSNDFLSFLTKVSSYSAIHKIGFPFAFLSLRKKIKDRRGL